MKISWAQNRKMEETEAYKAMREMVQQGLGINKDKMFAKEQPFGELDKLYAGIKELTGFDINGILRNDNSPSWFQDISHSYLMLDMHGYQQDKIKVDQKNHDTMRNTIDDGFHAAFASTCEFYITNDARSANKAKQVYQKLQVNTRICSPDEFVAYGTNSLVYDDPRVHLKLWLKLLGSPDYTESLVEDAIWRTYLLEFYLFDYFNMVSLVYAPDHTVPLILLRKNKPTNYRVTTALEVKAIIEKLNVAFETNEGQRIDPDRILSLEDLHCQWLYQGAAFRLQLLNGYLQLYMDLPEQTTRDSNETNDSKNHV